MTNVSWRPLVTLCLLLISPILLISQIGKDAALAVPICGLETYTIQNIEGFGNEELSYYNLNCFSKSFKESNSHWMKLSILEQGILTFFIAPHDIKADIDFVVFKSVGEDQITLVPIRCMGSGMENKSSDANLNRSISQPCLGHTGLSINSLDDFEKTGCAYNDDNFLKYIRCYPNDELFVVVNNHSNAQGFDIHFEGDVVLRKYPTCRSKQMDNSITDIDLYPNPASETLQLSLTLESAGLMQINILDFTGKQVLTFREKGLLGFNRLDLPIKDLTSGTYILSTTKGDKPVYKQFVKI